MFLVRLCLFVCVNLFLCANCSIPTERLCANPTCTEPISEGRGKIRYTPHTSGVLSFHKNEEIQITSKSKNANEYWGAVIKGKRGYVPSEYVFEKKVYHSLDKLVPVAGEATQPPPTGEGNTLQGGSPGSILGQLNNTEGLKESINPEKSFKVVEGTTFYADEPDEITPSATVDSKSDQTVAPMGVNVKKEDVQERATIPPEILNFNNNYNEQAMQNGVNYIVEKAKEDDENAVIESKDDDEDEEEEGDEEEGENEGEVDDEEEDEEESDNLGGNELKENLEKEIIGDELAEGKKQSKIVGSSGGILTDKLNKGEGEKEAEKVTTPSSILNEEANSSQSVVNIVENSVTSQVSASTGKDKMEVEKMQFAESGQTPMGIDVTEVPAQPNTRTPLNGPKMDFPSVGSLRMMHGTPQPIMAGRPDQMATPATPQAVSSEPNQVPAQSQGQPHASQLPPMPHGMPPSQLPPMPQGMPPSQLPPMPQGMPPSQLPPMPQGMPPSQLPPMPQGMPPSQLPPMPQGMPPSQLPPMPQGMPPSQLPPMPQGMPSPQAPVPSQGLPTTPGIPAETPQKTSTQPLKTSPEPQVLPLASQGISPPTQNILSEPPLTSSVPGNQPAPQEVSPEPENIPVAPPEVYAQQPENEPQSAGLETAETQQSTVEASVGELENATDDSPQDLGSVAPTQEQPAEALPTTSQPALLETSTIYNQFSVSADSLPGNPRQDSDKLQLTPEVTGERAEATTETFSTPPETVHADTENQFPGSPTPTPEATSDAIEEAVETVTSSVSPQPGDELKVSDNEVPEEEITNPAGGPGLVDQITGMFSSWFASTPREEERNTEPNHEPTFHGDLINEKETPGSSQAESDGQTEKQLPDWLGWILSSWGAEGVLTPSNTFTYLVVTAVTVLLFTLGHNFIEKRGKTGPLIAKINKLEHELLVSSKECLNLKEEVQHLREKNVLYENSANDELVLSLQSELEQSKKARSELEASIEILQQELDAATEAGLDLNKMLAEVLTQRGDSETLLKSIEDLQTQLDSQKAVIDEMTKKLGVKSQENIQLQSALEAANERSETLEEQLGDIKYNMNLHLKKKEELTQDLNSQINQLKTQINQVEESKAKDISRLKKESEELEKKLSESSKALTVKEGELKALKESMKHLKGKVGEVKLETVFDVSRVKGELAKEAKENQALMEKLQKEEGNRKTLSEQVKSLEEEMKKMRKSYEEAEQKKEEAEKKLEVLSTYFKEKETQLQKELGMQEALWAQKKGDEKAVYNMMKSLQEEVESYKSQNETLKKEILDQERGLKNQMATLEQKAHENWVAARQAERKLEESKQEMAQLRNRLTLVEKNSNNVEGKGNLRSSEELNGVEAASPIMHDTSSPLLFPPLPLDPNSSSLLPPGFIPPPMFMPPPMGGFMPPPPFLPGDRRPPPLGRMSSPPLNNRFSPSSADYPFERMASPPLSPHGTKYRSPNEDRDHYRHRTPPYPPPLHPRNWDDANEIPGFIPISSQRDSRRDHKGGSNVSSGDHSSSESLDKSSRHSGRV